MTAKRFFRRFAKITGIILGGLLILLVAFHFWFVNHAEQLLQNLVETRSNGKLKLKVDKLRFHWFSKKVDLVNASFYSTDSTDAASTYQFSVKNIHLKVKALLPMIFEKKVLIKTMTLTEPDIRVTRLRPSRDTINKDEVSLPLEMGRIYNSIQDALNVLKVNEFEMNGAKFTLINKMAPDELPVVITNIDFHMENLVVDQGKLTGKERIFFSDNIILKSRDQNIVFPDRRHSLAFRNFRINIEKKIAEFDSCTIAATRTDSSGSSFSVFFDKLVMTNIDFDTLYHNEVIKADSVYCTNPQFRLDLELGNKSTPRPQGQRLDKIIQQLTGDMLLNFVVVNNADFDINTMRNGKPSSFTSRGNDFEMQGVRISGDALKPVLIRNFGMTIRKYENFLRDSSFAMQFDSITFINDRIYLNNFAFQQLLNGKPGNHFSVPRFQLIGLSWDALLFDSKLVAREAILYHPSINYEINPPSGNPSKQLNVFQALATLNDFLLLENLDIVKGKIDLRMTGSTEVHLSDATLSVQSKSLLGSHQLQGIRQSIEHLEFSDGLIRTRGLELKLHNIYYTGNNSHLQADSLDLQTSENNLKATAKGVVMDEVVVNENTGDVDINGIQWNQASLNINEPGATQKKAGTAFILLKNIKGGPTSINTTIGKLSLQTSLQHVSAYQFLLEPGKLPSIDGLSVAGKNLSLTDPVTTLNISAFRLTDKQNAYFEAVNYQQKTRSDTISAILPQLSFVPDVSSIISGKPKMDNIELLQPVIDLRLWESDSTKLVNRSPLPTLFVGKLLLKNPDIHLESHTRKGALGLIWKGQMNDNNSLLVTDAVSDSTTFSARSIDFSLNNFKFTTFNGKTFNAGNGFINASMNDFRFEEKMNGADEWSAKLNHLEAVNFVVDSLGKKNGKLDIKTLHLDDLAINSSSINSIKSLVAANKQFRLTRITGTYSDNNTRLKWYNATYDKGTRLFTLDSIAYAPALDKDAFVAAHPYQTDYIRTSTGALSVGPIDLEKYLEDTVLNGGTLKIRDMVFTDYRDNHPPFHSGITKFLPAPLLKRIPLKFSLDTVLIENAHTTYSEFNPRTNKVGVIPIAKMTLRLFPVRNYNLSETDSLRIQVNGYLMDTVWLRLRLRESYTDSLAGFLFTVRMRPGDMHVLNPALIPLTSSRLISGWLDTLSMRVAGNDYLAFGEIRMFYHNLKIGILKDGNERKKGVFTTLLNFIANTFVIKNKNTQKLGDVFYVRKRDRSSLNYLIKIAMSGITNTIGSKNNRKIMRKYKKELRERNLPPMDYD